MWQCSLFDASVLDIVRPACYPVMSEPWCVTTSFALYYPLCWFSLVSASFLTHNSLQQRGHPVLSRWFISWHLIFSPPPSIHFVPVTLSILSLSTASTCTFLWVWSTVTTSFPSPLVHHSFRLPSSFCPCEAPIIGPTLQFRVQMTWHTYSWFALIGIHAPCLQLFISFLPSFPFLPSTFLPLFL